MRCRGGAHRGGPGAGRSQLGASAAHCTRSAHPPLLPASAPNRSQLPPLPAVSACCVMAAGSKHRCQSRQSACLRMRDDSCRRPVAGRSRLKAADALHHCGVLENTTVPTDTSAHSPAADTCRRCTHGPVHHTPCAASTAAEQAGVAQGRASVSRYALATLTACSADSSAHTRIGVEALSRKHSMCVQRTGFHTRCVCTLQHRDTAGQPAHMDAGRPQSLDATHSECPAHKGC